MITEHCLTILKSWSFNSLFKLWFVN